MEVLEAQREANDSMDDLNNNGQVINTTCCNSNSPSREDGSNLSFKRHEDKIDSCSPVQRNDSPEHFPADYRVANELEACKALLRLSDVNRDVGTQVSSGDLIHPSFISYITSNSVLNILTGITTMATLDSLALIIEEQTEPRNKHILTVKERIVLTLMKIKQDLSYSMLAALFHVVSRQTVARIFKTTIIMLEVLSQMIYWPSRKEIDDNMPLCFTNYMKTRVILDGTEIPVERPKCLRCRVRCYSQYKSTFTIKYLTGVTPAGTITYVSEGYGGRASDKFMFMKSGLLEKMSGGEDAVMVDKGFLIEIECAAFNIDLIQPSFLRAKKQFSYEEAELNRGIAAARVHIERVNQRIKIFKILKNRFPWGLILYADHIFNIACVLVNMSSPILSAHKF